MNDLQWVLLGVTGLGDVIIYDDITMCHSL